MNGGPQTHQRLQFAIAKTHDLNIFALLHCCNCCMLLVNMSLPSRAFWMHIATSPSTSSRPRRSISAHAFDSGYVHGMQIKTACKMFNYIVLPSMFFLQKSDVLPENRRHRNRRDTKDAFERATNHLGTKVRLERPDLTILCPTIP